VGIVEFIVKETNRYATQPLQNFGSGRMKHWGGGVSNNSIPGGSFETGLHILLQEILVNDT
jgi:hypothetical protein